MFVKVRKGESFRMAASFVVYDVICSVMVAVHCVTRS